MPMPRHVAIITLGDNREIGITRETNKLELLQLGDNYAVITLGDATAAQIDRLIYCLERLKTMVD